MKVLFTIALFAVAASGYVLPEQPLSAASIDPKESTMPIFRGTGMTLDEVRGLASDQARVAIRSWQYKYLLVKEFMEQVALAIEEGTMSESFVEAQFGFPRSSVNGMF